MADDIRAMTSELARNPDSQVFVRLGEALRVRGQIEAARKVVRAGLERNPNSADAHDLHARILVDAGELDGAEQEWNTVLAADRRHLGAHKGVGFLCYRRGDVDGALDHLELALSVDPTDQQIVQALQMVRDASGQRGVPLPGPVPEVAGRRSPGTEGGERGILLVDPRGRVLGGGLRNTAGADVAEGVAAQLGGVSQEAERAARMLDLGTWSSISAEAAGGNMFLCQPFQEAVLLLVRDPSVTLGRMEVIAQKAAAQARGWLEAQTP